MKLLRDFLITLIATIVVAVLDKVGVFEKLLGVSLLGQIKIILSKPVSGQAAVLLGVCGFIGGSIIIYFYIRVGGIKYQNDVPKIEIIRGTLLIPETDEYKIYYPVSVEKVPELTISTKPSEHLESIKIKEQRADGFTILFSMRYALCGFSRGVTLKWSAKGILKNTITKAI